MDSQLNQLLNAAKNGDLEIIRHILDSGFDVNSCYGDKWTCLHYAVTVVQLFYSCAKQLDVISIAKQRNTPLMLATTHRFSESIKILLFYGASRNGIAHLLPSLKKFLSQHILFMLSPQKWSIVWIPELHHRYNLQVHQTVRLILYTNALAGKRGKKGKKGKSEKQSNCNGWIYLPMNLNVIILQYAIWMW